MNNDNEFNNINNTENNTERAYIEGTNIRKETFYNETVKQSKSNNKQKSYSFRKIIVACLVISIAGGSSMGAGYSIMQNFLIDNKNNVNFNENVSKVTTAQTVSETSNDIVSIIRSVRPSVVSINTITQKNTSYFGGITIPYEAEGAGSGVIFYEDENIIAIVTNYHVIEGATNISVSIEGAKDDVFAQIAGTDSSSDLAVITVNKTELSKVGINEVVVATFGDSDQLEAGESVIAIGNALGEGITTSGGMISATNKNIQIGDIELDVIQTDAAINPGNSGGALIDINGNIIGINTAKAFEEAVEGMGYAIPSNTVIPIINKLLTDGTIPKPFLGITGTEISGNLANLYGLPIGVLVSEVIPGGSADKAGVQAGDIITDFAGKKIMTMDNLIDTLSTQSVGTEVDIRIIRNGDTPMTFKVMILDANKENQNINTKNNRKNIIPEHNIIIR